MAGLVPQNRKALRITLRRVKRRTLVYVLRLRRRIRPIPCILLAQFMALGIANEVMGGEWPYEADLVLGSYVWCWILFGAFVGVRKAVRRIAGRKMSAGC